MRVDQIGLGWLRLTPSVLNELTFYEFFAAVEGFNEVQKNDYQNRYEAARFTAWMVIGSMSNKATNPQGLVRFPWESEKAVKREKLTNNDIKRLVKKWRIK